MVPKWVRIILGGQRHDDCVKSTVLQWLHQAADFYDEGIKNLVVRYDALILEEILWKSRLKCGLLSKNKIVTIFLLVFLYLKTVLT